MGFLCVLSATLSQRLCMLCVVFRLRLMCSYVTLCGEFHAKTQSLCVSCVCSICFERSASQRLDVLILGFALLLPFVSFVVHFCRPQSIALKHPSTQVFLS